MTTAHIEVFGIPSSAIVQGGRFITRFAELSIECPTQIPAGACAKIRASLIDGRWVASSAEYFTLVAGGTELGGARGESATPAAAQPAAIGEGEPATLPASPAASPGGNVQPLTKRSGASISATASSPFATLARRMSPAPAPAGQPSPPAARVVAAAGKSAAAASVRPPFDPDNFDPDEDIPF